MAHPSTKTPESNFQVAQDRPGAVNQTFICPDYYCNSARPIFFTGVFGLVSHLRDLHPRLLSEISYTAGYGVNQPSAFNFHPQIIPSSGPAPSMYSYGGYPTYSQQYPYAPMPYPYHPSYHPPSQTVQALEQASSQADYRYAPQPIPGPRMFHTPSQQAIQSQYPLLPAPGPRMSHTPSQQAMQPQDPSPSEYYRPQHSVEFQNPAGPPLRMGPTASMNSMEAGELIRRPSSRTLIGE
jgi:hypothetical protein